MEAGEAHTGGGVFRVQGGGFFVNALQGLPLGLGRLVEVAIGVGIHLISGDHGPDGAFPQGVGLPHTGPGSCEFGPIIFRDVYIQVVSVFMEEEAEGEEALAIRAEFFVIRTFQKQS